MKITENNKIKFSPIFNKMIKNRFLIIFITLLFIGISITGLLKLNLTVSTDDFFLKDDPVSENQSKYKELFGNNDFIGVLVESDDVFSKESIEMIHNLGERLKLEVPFSKKITSIASSEISNLNRGGLKFKDGKLISENEELAKLKKSYLEMPLIGNRLFSKDCKQAWILLSLSNYTEKDELDILGPQIRAGKKAWEIVQEFHSDNIKLTATGVPVYTYRKQVETIEDLIVVLVVGFLVAIAVSIFMMRNFQSVFGTLLVIFSSVIIVLGIEGLLNTKIDSAFIAVPILLSVGVSIGYTVHISRFFTINFKKSGKRIDSILMALQESGKPISFTAFTTIVALVSFLFVQIRPIRWVGFTSAACIFTVYLLSISLFPIILSFGKNNEEEKQLVAKNDFLTKLLLKFTNTVLNRTKAIFEVFFIFLTISIIGISRLEVDFDAVKIMGSKLPHMKEQIHVDNSEIAVSNYVDLVIQLAPGSAKEPDFLKKVLQVEEYASHFPLVKNTTSLSTIVKDFNYFTHNNNSDHKKIPETKAALRGLLMYFNRLNPNELDSWVSDDSSAVRIFLELNDFSSKEISENITEIENFSKTIFDPECIIYFSGSAYQMTVMNQYVSIGLIKSILISLILISILMIVVFRSIKIGLSAMVPNILPVMFAGGLMGLLNIPLEFISMTIAPLLLGLAVDDTIHLVFHLKKNLELSNDFDYSITKTFKTVGSAITETTIILCATFLVFTVSKVNSVINIGMITATGMLTAYLSDIFVTPLLVKNIMKTKNRKSQT